MQRVKGSTNQSIRVDLRNTDGTPATIEHDAAGLAMYYQRSPTATPTQIEPAALADINAAHTDGGVQVIPNSGGAHRIDLPDAVFATGVDEAIFTIAATGIDPVTVLIELLEPLALNGDGLPIVSIGDVETAADAVVTALVQAGIVAEGSAANAYAAVLAALDRLPAELGPGGTMQSNMHYAAGVGPLEEDGTATQNIGGPTG